MPELPEFRAWYQARHGVPFPGSHGEPMDTVTPRVFQAMADYMNLLRDHALAAHPELS